MADFPEVPTGKEANQAVLRRYLAIDASERLKIVEGNLALMVQAMLKEDPGEVGVKLNLPAVLLDVVREIRWIKQHLGLIGAGDSAPVPVEPTQSSPVIRVEQIPLDASML